jgi:hypothetical protein
MFKKSALFWKRRKIYKKYKNDKFLQSISQAGHKTIKYSGFGPLSKIQFTLVL